MHDNIAPVRTLAIDSDEVAHPLDDLTPLASCRRASKRLPDEFVSLHASLPSCTYFCSQHTISFRLVSLFHPPSLMRLNSHSSRHCIVSSPAHAARSRIVIHSFVPRGLHSYSRWKHITMSCSTAQFDSIFALACQPSQLCTQLQTLYCIIIMNFVLSNGIASRCSAV
jgi:hypothetical protein